MIKSAIKQIIWDVDGTLYQNIPELTQCDNTFQRNFLAKYLPELSEAQRLYRLKEMMKKYKGSTLAMSKISGLSITEVGWLNEQALPRSHYIKKDPKLRQLFQKIKDQQITNYVLRNGITTETKKIIKLLGLAPDDGSETRDEFFSQIIGSFDSIGKSKPDLAVFEYFVKNFRLNPAETLSIGDRIEIELVPAKKLGMQTALVWQKSIPEKSKSIVDFVLPTVYDLASIL